MVREDVNPTAESHVKTRSQFTLLSPPCLPCLLSREVLENPDIAHDHGAQ